MGSITETLKGTILALGLLVALAGSLLPAQWSAGLDIVGVHVSVIKLPNSVRFRTEVSASEQSDGPRRAIMMLALAR